MSYLTQETSQHDGEPLEVFKFIAPAKNYLYTSAETELVVAGEIYSPAIIRRKPVKTGTHNDDNVELELSMPVDLQLVRDCAYTSSPQKIQFENRRSHRGLDLSSDFLMYWKGRVGPFKVVGSWATVRIPSALTRILQGSIPHVYYQNPCNHQFMDNRCKVSSIGNSTTTTVSLVGTSAITVADDGFENSFLKAGEIRVVRTNERRLIIDNVANVITINFPFHDIVIGDSVELFAGCDHAYLSVNGCAKYLNKINYGGHPHIPADSPFTGEL